MSTWLDQGVPRELVKCYFCASGRVFWKEISIWIIRLSKKECRPPQGWIPSTPWRACIEEGRGSLLSLFVGSGVFCSWSPWLLGLWTQIEFYPWLSWFASFSTFIIAHADSYTKSYMYNTMSRSLYPTGPAPLVGCWLTQSSKFCPPLFWFLQLN